MPLRNHFRPPVENEHSWDELHGMRPAVIVPQLFPKLPERYIAAPACTSAMKFGFTMRVMVGGLSRRSNSSALPITTGPSPVVSLMVDPAQFTLDQLGELGAALCVVRAVWNSAIASASFPCSFKALPRL